MDSGYLSAKSTQQELAVTPSNAGDYLLLDKDGAFAGAQILYHDLTELQAETEDFTRLMLDVTPLPCSLWDMDGSLITVNLHTLRLFGFAKRSGKPLFEALMELARSIRMTERPLPKKSGR
jgi:PAS domain-containing protein